MHPSFLQRYLAAFHGIQGWFSFDAALMFMAYNQCVAAPADTLEIGVFHGLSSIAVAALRGRGRKFYAVDLFEELGDNEGYGAGASYRKIFEDNMQSMLGPLDFVVTIATASNRLNPADFPASFSFCHVDGGHSPQETYDDLQFVTSILPPGGLVALDDYFNPQHPGVCEGALDFMRHHEGVLTPIAIGYNKVLFQKQPSAPSRLNAAFSATFPNVRYRETTMWNTPVYLFDTPLRTYFDLYASTPEKLIQLGDAGPRATFHPEEQALRSRRGKKMKLPVTVKNVSLEPFAAGDRAFGLSYHVLSAEGQMLQHDNPRSYLMMPLMPGAEVKLNIEVTAPQIRGSYQLELDLVWEGIMWFKDVGNPTCSVSLEVL